MYQELYYLKGLQAELEKVQSFTLPQSNPGLLLTLNNWEIALSQNGVIALNQTKVRKVLQVADKNSEYKQINYLKYGKHKWQRHN